MRPNGTTLEHTLDAASPLHDALLAPLSRVALGNPLHLATAKQLQRLLRRQLRKDGERFYSAKGSLGQALCSRVVAQVCVHRRQGVQDIGHIGVVRADGALHEGERPPAKWDCLVQSPLGPSGGGQIVEANGSVQGVTSSTPSASLLGRQRR